MPLQTVVEGVHALSLGQVNVFLLHGADGFVLVDTAVPGSEGKILQALGALGVQPGDIRHILLTHGHPDHTGSAAALARATGATVSIHAEDAEIARTGTGFRPLHPAPGPVNRVLFGMVHRFTPKAVEPVAITHTIEDGAELPFAGGVRAIHAPGHCAGQLAFLWPGSGGLLLAADSCMHILRLGLTMAYEDLNLGRRSLRTLASLEFEHAVFGHGKPLIGRAGEQFRKAFA